MISRGTKQGLTVVASLATIAVSAIWIYRTQFAAPPFNVVLHQAVGRVMAEETSRLVGDRGKIVIVAMEFSKVPEMRVQLEEFKKTLQQISRIAIDKTYNLDTEDQPKYGLGSGLSGRRYVRIVNKNTNAAAIVSFVGAPRLADDEMAQLNARPRLIAEARSPSKLKPLFDKQVLQAAIVARFEFPTPVKGKPRTPREWFDQRFQVVTAANANSLPAVAERNE
jgi:hypothetical protein